MGLIDNTYFINDINIAGTILSSQNNFDDVIDRYEPEILECGLGYELYKALLADLDVSGDPQTQRFIDLIDGAEFTFEVCGETVTEKWEGLRNTDKKSLCSYYVYFQYRSETDSFYSASGQQNEALTENSTKSDNYAKLVKSWNKMVLLYGDVSIHCYGSANRTISNYGYRTNYRDISTYEHYNDLPSMYNFLLANKDNYPEWIFKPIKKLNQFDI